MHQTTTVRMGNRDPFSVPLRAPRSLSFAACHCILPAERGGPCQMAQAALTSYPAPLCLAHSPPFVQLRPPLPPLLPPATASSLLNERPCQTAQAALTSMYPALPHLWSIGLEGRMGQCLSKAFDCREDGHIIFFYFTHAPALSSA
jgi:hypothetical protein